jgi:hypothetical protein
MGESEHVLDVERTRADYIRVSVPVVVLHEGEVEKARLSVRERLGCSAFPDTLLSSLRASIMLGYLVSATLTFENAE